MLDVTNEARIMREYRTIARDMNIADRRFVESVFRDTYEIVAIAGHNDNDSITDEIRVNLEYAYVLREVKREFGEIYNIQWIEQRKVWAAWVEDHLEGYAVFNEAEGKVMMYNHDGSTR